MKAERASRGNLTTESTEDTEKGKRKLSEEQENSEPSKWLWDEKTEQLFWQPRPDTVYHCRNKRGKWWLFKNGRGGSEFTHFRHLDSFAVNHMERCGEEPHE